MPESSWPFQWREYLAIHRDLLQSGLRTEEDALRHYQFFGQYEKRPGSLQEQRETTNGSYSFDPKEYRMIYPDIARSHLTTAEDLLTHFIYEGFREGRARTFQELSARFMNTTSRDGNQDGEETTGKKQGTMILPGEEDSLYAFALSRNTLSPPCPKRRTTTNHDPSSLSSPRSPRRPATKQMEEDQLVDTFCLRHRSVVHIDTKEEWIQRYHSAPNAAAKPVQLWVDFANLGGGTTFFINSIVSRYKQDMDFLIIRPKYGHHDQVLQWWWNEEAVMETFVHEEKDSEWSWIPSLSKIFLNHTAQHSITFLYSLLSYLQQRDHVPVWTITHDHSMIMDASQLYYHALQDPKHHLPSPLLSFVDGVVFQHAMTEELLGSFFPERIRHRVVAPLPDFTLPIEKDQQAIHLAPPESELVLGLLGAIQKVKGIKVLWLLALLVQKGYFWNRFQKKVRFVIFGQPSEHVFPDVVDVAPYTGIRHLNRLLQQYRPHAFLDLSLWPETWSYTLTLALQTRLPILSLEKPFPSVIECRGMSSSPTFSTFSTLSELCGQLSSLLSHPPTCLLPIRPVIEYPEIWDHILLSSPSSN